MPLPITLCGSISQNASPLGMTMHNAAYRALGLAFTYVPFEVTDVSAALRAMRALGIRGFGVSHPFKQEVMAHLDELDPIAARIGAVNTVVNDRGRLVGHNTDWKGASLALEEVCTLAGARVLVIGAGGAARAIAFGLTEARSLVTVTNRTRAKAEALAQDVGGHVDDVGMLGNVGAFDVVVNATAQGQGDVDPRSPLPAGAMRPGQVVMDIVYKPWRTKLLEDAKAAGARVVDGSRMLLHQARRQFELYTGVEPPLAVMDDALRGYLAGA